MNRGKLNQKDKIVLKCTIYSNNMDENMSKRFIVNFKRGMEYI